MVEDGDYSFTLPKGWTYQNSSINNGIGTAYFVDSSLYHRITKVDLEENETSLDYLNIIERFLYDLGYSENVVELSDRFGNSNDAQKFNADDFAYGVFGIEKEGEFFIRSVVIYRKGENAFLCVTFYPSLENSQFYSDWKILTSTFRLKD
jgi:hypothetical protein